MIRRPYKEITGVFTALTLLLSVWLWGARVGLRESAPDLSAEAVTVTGAARVSQETEAWSSLRGPNYDGHSTATSLVDSWPEQGPPVLWARELGQGYSGFIAWNDRVATQYQTLSGQYVICMLADTGETIWRHRYEWPYEIGAIAEGWRQGFDESASVPLVAVDDSGAIVGIAAGGEARGDEPPTAVELFMLYVLEEYYGTGLGRALTDAAIGNAPACVWVLEGNERAIAFYRKLGFAPDGESEQLSERWNGLIEIRMVRPAMDAEQTVSQQTGE